MAHENCGLQLLGISWEIYGLKKNHEISEMLVSWSMKTFSWHFQNLFMDFS